MIDHNSTPAGASPVTALIALAAAAAGYAAHVLDGAGHLFAAAPSPDDITAYAKAICGAVAMAINLLVGGYHAVKTLWAGGRAVFVRLQRGRKRRRTPKHRNTPGAGPAPHTDPTPGAQSKRLEPGP